MFKENVIIGATIIIEEKPYILGGARYVPNPVYNNLVYPVIGIVDSVIDWGRYIVFTFEGSVTGWSSGRDKNFHSSAGFNKISCVLTEEDLQKMLKI